MRDRRSPDRRIKPGELALQPQKRLVHDRPDRSQRMIPPHPRLQVNVAEQLARSIVAAAHVPSPNLVGANESRSTARRQPPFFNSLLVLFRWLRWYSIAFRRSFTLLPPR